MGQPGEIHGKTGSWERESGVSVTLLRSTVAVHLDAGTDDRLRIIHKPSRLPGFLSHLSAHRPLRARRCAESIIARVIRGTCATVYLVPPPRASSEGWAGDGSPRDPAEVRRH